MVQRRSFLLGYGLTSNPLFGGIRFAVIPVVKHRVLDDSGISYLKAAGEMRDRKA